MDGLTDGLDGLDGERLTALTLFPDGQSFGRDPGPVSRCLVFFSALLILILPRFYFLGLPLPIAILLIPNPAFSSLLILFFFNSLRSLLFPLRRKTVTIVILSFTIRPFRPTSLFYQFIDIHLLISVSPLPPSLLPPLTLARYPLMRSV
ncbi:uncharacterized protein LDX57_003595 [Aspergillus melleus]|uniref:uncharacterized protein n=1 Tax=Aspergillus melleus TaxID=138277 RepID=UPI001E8DEEFF|nr:uncharacterized protein LDX57_003595 [Aspergillus melleus]KAH8425851.1 hypothetical protein LDX57_003595 [Aspergillus melleus]